ncbi:MAG: plastocyanin/azurin family copper-binding protein, partial [Nitrososphaerales archaeon]
YRINSSVTALSNSSTSAASSSTNSVPTGQLLMEFSYPGTLLVSSDLFSLNYTVKFDALGNVPGSIALKAIAPPGLSAAFSPENLTLASQNTANLQVSSSKSTPLGNYQLRMVASGNGATYTQNETIQVVKNLVVTLGSSFLPRNLTVSQGDTITWLRLNGALSQYDDGAHNVVFSSSSFSAVSPTLVQYQVWSYVFNQTGNFNYYCKYHPLMTGDITVVASS